jgi:N-acetylglutamate synthase-like GNAT family acetyltransferase
MDGKEESMENPMIEPEKSQGGKLIDGALNGYVRIKGFGEAGRPDQIFFQPNLPGGQSRAKGAVMQDQYPKTVRLEDGFELTLRPMTSQDGDRLYRFFVSLPESDRRYLRNDTVNRILIENWCRSLNYDKVLPILAENNGVLIANGTLHRETHGWSKHIGEIRMTIASPYQHRGIGRILTEEITWLARELGVERLMARVVTSRDYVINLFELNGFKQIAALKNFVKSVVDNSYKDIAILVKDL